MNAPPDAPSPTPPAATRPAPGRGWAWLLLLALLALGGWRAWDWWQQRQQGDAGVLDMDLRVAALEQRVDGLRRDQRSQLQRLQQAEATNRVLRDELLGIGQRAALLEDSVSRLADPDRHGAQALRLDEAELLLSMARHRLQFAADLDGARRAYALAAGVLAGVDDPAYLSLRQTLAQERAALDALGTDPARTAAGRLDAFAAQLDAMPRQAAAPVDAARAWPRRLLDSLVTVRRADTSRAGTPGEWQAGRDALRVELSLARAALERRDAPAWRGALARIDRWLPRLWPESAAMRTRRQELQALRALPLQLDLPVLGSTLDQLRAMRAAR